MMMIQNHTRYTGTVCRGEPRILQPAGSGTHLEIPAGITGVYRMSSHTNHSKYKGMLKAEECIVSPTVEVVSRATRDTRLMPGPHVLNIPHCLREESQLQLLRVEKADLEQSIPFHPIPHTDDSLVTQDSFSADLTHVRITCSSFSVFTCKTCKTTCQSTVKALLYANLDPWPSRNVTTLQLKAYMCSYLYRIEDYREVFVYMIIFKLIVRPILLPDHISLMKLMATMMTQTFLNLNQF